MWIDDEGIHVPSDAASAMTLELSGRRIWAFVPRIDGRRSGNDHRLVPWPEMLRPHLDGRAIAELKALPTGESLFRGEVVLGSGRGSIDLVDKVGRPLAVDKSGHVTAAMFGDADEEQRGLLVDAVVDALALMAERGHDAFLAYGNLLGAVRDGRLIGHDDDADVAFLAKSQHPVGVILESLAIEREFRSAGWETARWSPGTFKLYPELAGGPRVGIDVFSAFHYRGLLHVMAGVAAPLGRDALLPTTTVTLEGRMVPAPADPEALLEATYGPGWRVPDPAFRYETPRWLRRRLRGLMRGERKHQRSWNTYYEAGPRPSRQDDAPSGFARWVMERGQPSCLVDVGCGTGEDAVWFATQGVDVVGLDYASSGLARAQRRATELGQDVPFRQFNLYDVRQPLVTGALMARERRTDAVYGRLLLDALEDDGRRNLWRFCRSVLAPARGRIYLEFLTEGAAGAGQRHQHLVPPAQVADELAAYGFEVEHIEQDVDPTGPHPDVKVCRLVAASKESP